MDSGVRSEPHGRKIRAKRIFELREPYTRNNHRKLLYTSKYGILVQEKPDNSARVYIFSRHHYDDDRMIHTYEDRARVRADFFTF